MLVLFIFIFSLCWFCALFMLIKINLSTVDIFDVESFFFLYSLPHAQIKSTFSSRRLSTTHWTDTKVWLLFCLYAIFRVLIFIFVWLFLSIVNEFVFVWLFFFVLSTFSLKQISAGEQMNILLLDWALRKYTNNLTGKFSRTLYAFA